MARLKPEDRERLIVEGAIKFFSQHGFSGPTRNLAKELGVTQPLLYRYFPSKQALIDRVYKELFLNRWNPRWPRIIRDRNVSLDQRIQIFYLDFIERIFSRDWVRIFVHSGLEDVGYNRRVLKSLEEQILRPLCIELRATCGLEHLMPDEITPSEIEYAWELHGIAFYYYIRKFIYETQPQVTVEALVSNMAESFVSGAPKVLARIISEGNRKA